jgi:AraC family transcriptional regulator
MEPRVNAPTRPKDCQTASLRTSAPDVNARDLTPIVMALLQSSLKHLDTDRDTAAELISKACSLLEVADGSTSNQDRSVRGGLAPWQMRRIAGYIDTNLSDRIGIAELAAMAKLGPSHFRRAFKKCFGIGPHAYLMQRRVRRAQEIMMMTDCSICEIALAVGFADQAHLTTRFHRIVGTTPHAWRRERNGGTTRRPPINSHGVTPAASRASIAHRGDHR